MENEFIFLTWQTVRAYLGAAQNGRHSSRNNQRRDTGGEEEVTGSDYGVATGIAAGATSGIAIVEQFIHERPDDGEPSLMRGAQNGRQNSDGDERIHDKDEAKSDAHQNHGIQHEDGVRVPTN